MYDRILLATDGSENAREAAEHAVDLARQYEAELHGLYVVETRTAYDNAIVDPERVREKLHEDGRNTLTRFETAAADADTNPITAIEEGVPTETIAEYSRTNDVDLIVVGAQGQSAFKTVLLGSTTEALLRSEFPVLVVGGEKRT